ncbi:MAG: phage tail family protein, partial [Bacilli bacterium]
GDVLTINTERGNEHVTLTRNNVRTNMLNYLTLESNVQMQLDIGDNLIRYDAETNVDNLEVSIYFTPQYVGV